MKLLICQNHILVIQFVSHHSPPILILTLLYELLDSVLKSLFLRNLLQILVIPDKVFITVFSCLQPANTGQYLSFSSNNLLFYLLILTIVRLSIVLVLDVLALIDTFDLSSFVPYLSNVKNGLIKIVSYFAHN